MSILNPATLAARVSSTSYHAGSPITGSAAGDYTIRDDAAHFFNIGIASDGVVDMGISLDSSLDADVQLQLIALNDRSGVGSSANSPGTILVSTSAGVDDMPTDSRWWILPEVSASSYGTASKRMIEVPELRAPITGLRLWVKARTAPTTGAFSFVVVRRY